MKKLILFLFISMFIKTNAQNLFNKKYEFPVFYQSAQIYLNPDFIPVTLTNVTILNSSNNNNFFIDSNLYLNYSTNNFNFTDSCTVSIEYSNNNNIFIDTTKIILKILGRANTYSNFYSYGKILKKEFYSSIFSDSTILGQTWNFGDNNTSNLQNPIHTYSYAGTFNVCLTAFTSVDTNQFCQKVEVKDTNFIELTDDYIISLLPDTATLVKVFENDNFYNPTFNIVKQGKFNEGSIINNKFFVKATKKSNNTLDTIIYSACKNGNCDSAFIYVYQFINYYDLPCMSNFEWTSNKKTVKFIAKPNCKSNTNSIQELNWRLDTLNIGKGDSINYNFNSYGHFNVCLDLIDTFGITNSSCQTISLFDYGCYPQFSYKGKSNKIQFYNETFCFPFINDTSTIKYIWNFGDGISKDTFETTHIFSTAGNYNVCLSRVEINDTFKTCFNITVYDSTSLLTYDDHFFGNTAQNPQIYNVLDNDISFNVDSIYILRNSNLGNTTISNNGNATYTRNNKYTYGIDSFTYVVCNNVKCDTAFCLIQNGYNDFNSDFDCMPLINYTSNGNQFTFNASSVCQNNLPGAYIWLFDDGSFDTSRQITKTFDYPGFKYVQLFLIDTSGKWSYIDDYVMIVDSSINNGCVKAQDDYFNYNFYNSGTNIVHNDININFKNARTNSIKDFNYGITLLDSLGNLNWMPDSSYFGCDTMVYLVFDSQNINCMDTASVFVCFEDLFSDCVDTTNIDTFIDCNYGYLPVCGCNNVEYDNICDAYFKGGINYYFNGPCSNLPPNLFINGSSSNMSYEISNSEVSEMKIEAIDPNIDNTVTINSKLNNESFSCLSYKIENGKIILNPDPNCTGNFKIYISTCDNWGYCNIDTLNIIVSNKTVSIKNNSDNIEFILFPNPTSNLLNFDLSTINEGDYFRIININGKEIISQLIVKENQGQIDLSNFEPGLYFIQLINLNGNLIFIQKINKL